MQLGGRTVPGFGLGDAAGDLKSALDSLGQFDHYAGEGDVQVRGAVYDLAIASYQSAGQYAVKVILPRLQSASDESGVSSGGLASAMAAAEQQLAQDWTLLHALPWSADPGNPVATPQTGAGAQTLALDMRAQLVTLAGLVQTALAEPAPAPAAAPAPSSGPWPMVAAIAFLGAAGVVAWKASHAA